MLALRTGWTPDMLADMPMPFLAACRWALYARTIAGPDGLPSGDVAPGVKRTPEHAKLSLRLREIRELLYPEDRADG